MKIYKLEREVDGYGGILKDEYFLDFQKAKRCVENMECVYHDEEKNIWDIYGMKECRVSEKEDEFYLLGIRYPDKDFDEWCLRYCTIKIEPIELKFEISNNEIYLLKYCRGYNHWLYSNLDNHYEYPGDYERNNRPIILGYYRSEKQARKMGARNKKWNKVGRFWVTPEFEKRCTTLGGGEDYLSIEKVTINE